MSDTTKGYGTTLTTSDASDGTYVAIAQIKDVDEGGLTAEEVDTSHMGSPNQAREKESDWINAENVSFDALYTDAQHALLVGYVGEMRYFKVTTPDGAVTGPIYGFVSKLGRGIPMAGRITSAVEITVSGAPTFTAGS